MFPVIPVDNRRSEALEPLGTKRKFWFTDGQGRRMLFKAEERGTGEDWAEKAACELCGLLGLPHVHYELAEENASRTPGVVCESLVTPGTQMGLGNQLLQVLDPAYPNGRKYKVHEHTVEAVCTAVGYLSTPRLPPDAALPPGIDRAVGVFVGYVMLDAWIANQDRHHENWGVLIVGHDLYLAPTFDHGASMARNLGDEERQERLITRDRERQIPAFARRARSAFYAADRSAKTMTTLAAWQAFSQKAAQASNIWVDRLRDIDERQVEGIFAQMPPNRLSPIAREFTVRLLAENRRRILEERSRG